MKMKKFLGALVLAVLVALPIKASAAEYSVTWGEECTLDSEGNCLVTPVLKQSGGASSSMLSATMTLVNLEYVGAEENSDWKIEVSGTAVVFTSKTGTAITDAESALGTLKFKKIDAAEECGLTFVCNGKTDEVKPTKTPVKSEPTGNFLPYAIIATGAVIAAGVYYVTRKSNKFYRI